MNKKQQKQPLLSFTLQFVTLQTYIQFFLHTHTVQTEFQTARKIIQFINNSLICLWWRNGLATGLNGSTFWWMDKTETEQKKIKENCADFSWDKRKS